MIHEIYFSRFLNYLHLLEYIKKIHNFGFGIKNNYHESK